MISLAMFNNKGGVGKTTLAYHLAHMISRMDLNVLAVDLDPQANLTAHFLDESELDDLWDHDMSSQRRTVAGAVFPIVDGTGDIAVIEPVEVTGSLSLLPGDLALSSFEERLAQEWPSTLAGSNNAAIRATSSFFRIITQAAGSTGADLVLIDVGPNLGALNRAALLAADRVLVPLGADLFSVQGLRNLGPALRRWRHDWQSLVVPKAPAAIPIPAGAMDPLGYVVMQPSMRLDRPVMAYQRWLSRIPQVYAEEITEPGADGAGEIATVRNFRSLMPLAHDARKPMFDLRAADGAIGSTSRYVQVCHREFVDLSSRVLARLGLRSPGAIEGRVGA